jgi:hypothetical protein
MQIFLGDRITLVKGETWITGDCSGIVLDDRKEVQRLYVHGLDMAFWFSEGWKLADEDDEEEFIFIEEEGEDE